MTAFVADADRRTEMAKKRLAETQEELSTDASEKVMFFECDWSELIEFVCFL